MSQTRRRHGFTLLEVLAAVAIMGILYSVLATVAARGIRSEGVNKRGLLAAQLADKALSELELQLVGGAVPEQSETESEEGDFLVRIEVLPMEAFADDQPAIPPPIVKKDQPIGDAPTNTLALLAAEAPLLQEHLSTFRVTVEWQEGVDEHSVVRNSFGLDLEGARQTFPIPGRTGAAEPSNSGFGDEDLSEEDLEQQLENLQGGEG